MPFWLLFVIFLLTGILTYSALWIPISCSLDLHQKNGNYNKRGTIVTMTVISPNTRVADGWYNYFVLFGIRCTSGGNNATPLSMVLMTTLNNNVLIARSVLSSPNIIT